jgi:predicted nucleic acid-binding protein
MLVVVDTNVMISALARRSPLAPMFRAIAKGELRLAITSAIVLRMKRSPSSGAAPHSPQSRCIG